MTSRNCSDSMIIPVTTGSCMPDGQRVTKLEFGSAMDWRATSDFSSRHNQSRSATKTTRDVHGRTSVRSRANKNLRFPSAG